MSEIKCRECWLSIETGEECIIVYEWTAKIDEEGLPVLDLPHNLFYPYYYHEDCFYNKR